MLNAVHVLLTAGVPSHPVSVLGHVVSWHLPLRASTAQPCALMLAFPCGRLWPFLARLSPARSAFGSMVHPQVDGTHVFTKGQILLFFVPLTGSLVDSQAFTHNSFCSLFLLTRGPPLLSPACVGLASALYAVQVEVTR